MSFDAPNTSDAASDWMSSVGIAVLIISSLLLSCLLVNRWWQAYISPWNNNASVPCIGVSLPIIGNLLSLNLDNVIKDLDRLHENFGDTFLVWVLCRPVVVTRDSRLFEKVLKSTNCDFFGKGMYKMVIFHT